MSIFKDLKEKFTGTEKGPAQKAGEKLDQAAGKAVAKAQVAVQKVGQKLGEAGKSLQEKAK